MDLQLKDEKRAAKPVDTYEREQTDNPWDNPRGNLDGEEPYTVTKSIKSTYVPEMKNNHIMDTVKKLIVLLLLAGLLIVAGKAIVAKLMPEGTDVTGMLEKPEVELETTLGITFTDNTTWAKKMIQYSGGKMTIRANEDLGVVYINGKRVGLHIDSKQYTMYGIQVGMSEKEANEVLANTFQYDDFITLIDENGKDGTTTYYYYSNKRNDCVSLLMNNSTNRIEAITYYNNFKLITKHADIF